MRDPHAMLQGAGITKQVRWLTFRPGGVIDVERCAQLLRDADAALYVAKREGRNRVAPTAA